MTRSVRERCVIELDWRCWLDNRPERACERLEGQRDDRHGVTTTARPPVRIACTTSSSVADSRTRSRFDSGSCVVSCFCSWSSVGSCVGSGSALDPDFDSEVCCFGSPFAFRSVFAGFAAPRTSSIAVRLRTCATAFSHEASSLSTTAESSFLPLCASSSTFGETPKVFAAVGATSGCSVRVFRSFSSRTPSSRRARSSEATDASTLSLAICASVGFTKSWRIADTGNPCRNACMARVASANVARSASNLSASPCSLSLAVLRLGAPRPNSSSHFASCLFGLLRVPTPDGDDVSLKLLLRKPGNTTHGAESVGQRRAIATLLGFRVQRSSSSAFFRWV